MIPEWAGEYVGIPHEDLDCWGLARRVMMERFDTFLPSYAHQAVAEGRSCFEVVETPEAGDLVIMRRLNAPHVGVMLDARTMLHSSTGKDACIERISAMHHVAGYYRVLGPRPE